MTIPQTKAGPYRCLSDAIKHGKLDRDAQRIGTLTIIKTPDGHDYVCGGGDALFPTDKVVYRYHYLAGICWSKPYLPTGERA